MSNQPITEQIGRGIAALTGRHGDPASRGHDDERGHVVRAGGLVQQPRGIGLWPDDGVERRRRDVVPPITPFSATPAPCTTPVISYAANGRRDRVRARHVTGDGLGGTAQFGQFRGEGCRAGRVGAAARGQDQAPDAVRCGEVADQLRPNAAGAAGDQDGAQGTEPKPR